MLRVHFASALIFVCNIINTTAHAQGGMAIDPVTCLGCHHETIPVASFAASVHGKISCTSCHMDIVDLSRHMRRELPAQKVDCERCHMREGLEYLGSVHKAKGISCIDCHKGLHSRTFWKGDKRIAISTCVRCHDRESVYRTSVHGSGVVRGNRDSAACHDCHNLHTISAINALGSDENRAFHTKVCLKCHGDRAMMDRNKIPNVAVKTYMESYHGKNYRLGFPGKVAGCADCHTSHAVFRKDDRRSSIHADSIAKTCSQCHKGSTALFARYYAHGEATDRANYPILFWTFVCMTGLLSGVFAIFWVHSLLWMFRAFVENRKREDALASGQSSHLVIPHEHRLYRRFSRKQIVMHLFVITSFLGLTATGLPLKFSDQGWARALMTIYGGAVNAGLIHRFCALLTFGYFVAALAMSVHFLLIRKDIPGSPLQRIFGPDSLCPNLRDVRDVIGMVKWFFFKGPKPSFDRWTYWEKFDFLAVFWGMFAIGGSGLMLWFPELFGIFMPGWMFNVATIIHSDEALLATGFIFTVHFFNTHGRPEKFPMDFVIFNGRISKREFIEERGDQWRRYEESGVTELYSCVQRRSMLADFLLKGFGFLAVLIGTAFLLLMIFAFVGKLHGG